MRVLDLFSGIGGFSLGLEWAGFETVAFCEIDKFCQKVLKKHWSKVQIWTDIKKLNRSCLRVLKSSAGVSPAKIYRLPVWAKESKPPVLVYGGRIYEPFAFFDQTTQSWRMWQRCLLGGWGEFAETWPTSGMTRNGIAYRLLKSDCRISEKESGLLPTPTASDHKGASAGCKKIKNKEISMLRYYLHYHYAKKGFLKTTYPHPEFVEQMMGFPTGHTELKLLETQ